MKTYPSIVRCVPGSTTRAKNVYVFDKLDGSNLRFEWSKKRGWHKYGTRKRLFDETDQVFGKAVSIFHGTLAKELDYVIRRERWQHVVAFTEFHGPRSFAGQHHPGDDHVVSLIDIAVDKKGILDPREYLRKVYPNVSYRAEWLGRMGWNEELVRVVHDGEWKKITSEGIVGKYMDGKRLMMLKAKTKAWKDKVKDLYGDQANSILES